MNEKELIKRIEELKKNLIKNGGNVYGEDVKYEQQIFRLEQLYDDLYGN